MSNIRWCGKKKCSECEEVLTCEVDKSLACSADCEGFIDGTELREADYCFKHCDVSKIRAVMEIEHGEDCELSDVFHSEPNHLRCWHCGNLILPGEKCKSVPVVYPIWEEDFKEDYLCMDPGCESWYMKTIAKVKTLE